MTLLRASSSGDTESVRKLVQTQSDVDVRARGTGRTPLLEAVISGHLDTVVVLLAASADIEARDTAVGFTPLGWAAAQGNTHLVRVLLEYGADVDSANGDFARTPLMLASQQGHADAVRILLEHTARFAITDGSGQNALSLNRESHGNDGATHVHRLLVEAGAVLPPPVPEPPALPWPSVAPAQVTYDDPVSVIRGFILRMAKWEQDALADRARDLNALCAERDVLASAYLSVRPRTYRPHSIGTPTEVDERETLHSVHYPKPNRCELVVRDPLGHPFRSERLYTAVKKHGEWRLDTLKTRRLGTADWCRALL